MKLFDQLIKAGDTVYSDSMGYGTVIQLLPNSTGLMVSHHGKQWRYNAKLIRSGCNQSDLSWHQKPNGVQLKDKKEQTKAETFLEGVIENLQKSAVL